MSQPPKKPWWNPFAKQTMQRPANAPGGPTKINTSDAEQPEISKAPGLMPWQKLVLHYLDRVPIASATARFYEQSTLRIGYTLVTEESGEDIALHPALQAIAILNAHKQEMARAAGLRVAIGEDRHTFDPTTLELTTRGAGELYYQSNGYVLEDREGKKQELDPNLYVWRSFDEDRQWSDLATSSFKAMLDVLESLVIVYAEERARSIRLAMNTGFVLMDESLFLPGSEDADDVNSEGSSEGAALEKRLAEMLQMTITNPRDSASFVPPVIIGDAAGGDVGKLIQHVSFAQERDRAKVQERIETLKEEFAVGVDLPADVAKGFLADMNHWNGEIVSEDTIKNYIAPKVQSIAEDAFEEICNALDIDFTGVTVGLDTSQLLSPADLSDTALQAFTDGLIGDKAGRKYAGFTEEDAPGTTTGGVKYVDPAASATTVPVPAPSSDSGPRNTDGEVGADTGEGAIAAAATDGQPDLAVLNLELSRARYRFEGELRAAINDAVIELAPLVNDQGGITAAADPDSINPIERVAALIAGIVRSGFSGMSLAAARGLASKRAGEWYANHEDRLDRQSERAGSHGAAAVLGWLRSKQATSIPGRDAYAISRSIESVGAGGPDAVYTDGTPTQARPKAIVEDADFLQLIRDEGSAVPKYEWEHGMPPQPFTPHVQLDGKTWFSADERTVLDNPDSFPKSAIYHPGDHDGCTCRYEVNFERI